MRCLCKQRLCDQLYGNLGHLPGILKIIISMPSHHHGHQTANTKHGSMGPKFRHMVGKIPARSAHLRQGMINCPFDQDTAETASGQSIQQWFLLSPEQEKVLQILLITTGFCIFYRIFTFGNQVPLLILLGLVRR